MNFVSTLAKSKKKKIPKCEKSKSVLNVVSGRCVEDGKFHELGYENKSYFKRNEEKGQNGSFCFVAENREPKNFNEMANGHIPNHKIVGQNSRLVLLSTKKVQSERGRNDTFTF